MATATETAEYAGYKIGYEVSNDNDGRWGDGTEKQAEVAADNLAALLEGYAEKEFPGADISIIATRNPAPHRSAEDAEGFEAGWIVEQLDNYLDRHWTNEALWEEDFDAADYLAKNPR